jgi:hypothetical protein
MEQSVANDCQDISNLKTVSGMVANECFNRKAFFHMLQCVHICLQDPTMKNKKLLALSWMSSCFQEIAITCLNRQSGLILSEDQTTLSISSKVKR